MSDEVRLTTKEFWTYENPGFDFERHSGHAIYDLIRKYLPTNKQGSCIEIGSFPGPFLTVFGDLGYTLNGIDFHPKNENELPKWLNSLGYKVGEFTTIDFFDYATPKKFDIVASFGFIEHFENYEEVILKHIDLVKDNGYIVITTPNFKGWMQRWLHNTFDKTNLGFHNLESMQPRIWARLLESNGFDILYHGYFGGFQFWKSYEKMNIFKRKIMWFTIRVIPHLNKMLWFESRAFSAYCGIIAKKTIRK